jgi:arsenite methyltransferase
MRRLAPGGKGGFTAPAALAPGGRAAYPGTSRHDHPTMPPLPDFPLTLTEVLALIDRRLGTRAMLADEGQDRVAPYYAQSRVGYDRVHSREGCMHVALNPDGRFDRAGYLAQPGAVSAVIAASGARRVLELGAGLGFNSRWLAARHPGVEFVALDLLPGHVAEARSRVQAAGLGNLRVIQGSHEDLPPGLGGFNVIFAIETLCYARAPVAVAAGLAGHLAPGGRFLAFEPLSTRPLAALEPEMALATRLYWLGVAVTRPVPTADDWQIALRGAGLVPEAPEDLTRHAAPGLKVLFDRALAVLRRPGIGLILPALPRYLKRNAATALAGPFVCFGQRAGRAGDGSGSVAYVRLGARHPG